MRARMFSYSIRLRGGRGKSDHPLATVGHISALSGGGGGEVKKVIFAILGRCTARSEKNPFLVKYEKRHLKPTLVSHDIHAKCLQKSVSNSRKFFFFFWQGRYIFFSFLSFYGGEFGLGQGDKRREKEGRRVISNLPTPSPPILL